MGNLRAFAKVQVGPWVLYTVRIVQQPGLRPWVQLPVSQASSGRRGYFPILTCHVPEIDKIIKAAVLEAWQAHQGLGVAS